jgi:uncharacterized membrane protein
MKLANKSLIILTALSVSLSSAFVPPYSSRSQLPTSRTSPSSLLFVAHENINPNNKHLEGSFTELDIAFHFSTSSENNLKETSNISQSIAPLAVASLAFLPLSAEASSGSNQIASAFVAYGHYLSLFVMVGALVFERLTVSPGMTKEKEQTLVLADAAYGLSAVVLLVSGYYRAVEYGKGWYFYSHEPIFWLKMIFFMILGSASLFPTITSIKRAVAASKNDDSWQPMSEKLANRMKSVINAELVMMGSIPLSATLMSRGVGYSEAIPFDIVGPALTALTAIGFGLKYSKEALTWSEEE